MKKLFILLLALVMMMSLALTSCGECEHKDADKDGICDECEEKMPGGNGKCTHKDADNDGVCDECKEKMPAASGDCKHIGAIICETCFEPLVSFESIEIPQMDSIAMKVTNFEIDITDSYYPEHSAIMTLEITEGFIGIDANGALEGYGTAKIKTDYKASVIPDASFEAVFGIENNIIYFSATGVAPMAASTEKGAAYGYVDISKNASVSELKTEVEGYLAMIEAYLPEVSSWITTSLAPVFENLDLSAVSNAANKYKAKLLNSMFEATKNSNGTSTIKFSLDAIKTLYKDVLNNNIDKLFDKLTYDGAFAEIEALLADDKFYNYSVADLLNYLDEKQGIKLGNIFAALDSLAVIITEDANATLEGTLLPMIIEMAGGDPAMLEGFDLDSFLENEAILALSVKDALAMAFMGSSFGEPVDAETLSAIKETVNGVVSSLKAQKLLALLPIDPEMLPSSGDFNTMIDSIEEMFSIVINVDKNNVATGMDAEANIVTPYGTVDFEAAFSANGSSISVEFVSDTVNVDFAINASSEKITVSMNQEITAEGVNAEATFEIIPDGTIAKNAAKISEIKEAIAKAPVTKEALAIYLDDYYSDDARAKVFDDTANNRFVIMQYNYANKIDANNIAAIISLTYIDYTDVFAAMTTPGCKNNVFISPIYNAKEGTVTVNMSAPDTSYGQLLFQQITLANIPEPSEENIGITTYSTEILYNTSSKTYSTDHIYENGHNYLIDETASTSGDSCTAIYKNVYKCEFCGNSYSDYYTNGHSYKISSTGSNGNYNVTQLCTNAGCPKSSAQNVGSITFSTTENVSYTTTSEDNIVFSFNYTPTADGEIEFSLDSLATADPSIKVEYGVGGSYYGYNYLYSGDVESFYLYAGNTYYFEIFMYSYDISGDFDYILEMNFLAE